MENNFIAIKGMNNFGGIGIIRINYGIDDTVTTAFDFGDGLKNKSTSKIHYNAKGEIFFVKLGQRHYIRDFMGV